MKHKRLWFFLMGLVITLGLAMCLDAAKRTPPQHGDWGLILAPGKIILSYRGPRLDGRPWLRAITAMPGVKIVQIQGELPKVGDVFTCSSSTYVIGTLKEDGTEVIETLLTCGGNDDPTVFRVVGITL